MLRSSVVDLDFTSMCVGCVCLPPAWSVVDTSAAARVNNIVPQNDFLCSARKMSKVSVQVVPRLHVTLVVVDDWIPCGIFNEVLVCCCFHLC